MTPHFKLQHTVLVMALAAIYPLQSAAAPSAGVAQFIVGDVNVRRADGGTSPLAKGNDIESGQAILTGAGGRAQVRFTDGGLVSLQPNTEFKVANYVDKADPKEDRFLVDLLRGSMRAITGLIGKRNRENYKVTTSTATIGIRGSGFNVGYNPDGSLGVTTELDAIEVCNAGGCVGLTAGESVRVVNNTDAPVRTNVRANVPTPPADTQRVDIEKVDKEGKNIYVGPPPPDPKPTPKPDPVPTPTPPDPNTGTFTNLTATATYYLPTNSGPGTVSAPGTASSATLNAGKLTALSAAGKDFTPTTTGSAGSVGSIADGDFIGWGSWTTGTRNPGSSAVGDLAYVIGQPTLVMPTTGSATYSVIGQTPVSAYDTSTNSAMASGTLTTASSSLNVNFSTGKVGVTIATSLGGFTASNISVSGSQFSYANGGPIYNVDGFFSGVNATRAGLVYTGTNGNTRYSGAAVFKTP
ncbi:FecR domain-containing protein [Polaromonas sp. YR568]|uniref:FecR domain-containing protein n=1 Tax=Polaromonas sp. YR568 TaxID=1855301 RepID=UPI00398BF312